MRFRRGRRRSFRRGGARRIRRFKPRLRRGIRVGFRM